MDFLVQALVVVVAFFSAWIPSHTFSFTADIPKLQPPRADIIVGGDMMFDRAIRVAAQKNGGDFIFSCIDGTLANADAVMANLEGPITPNASVSVGSVVASPDNFTFTFPTSTAALLRKHNVRIVNLGNNHIENFQASGVASTIAALDAEGVTYFGDPFAQTVAHLSINGVKLAFINFNQFARSSSPELTISQIQDARAAGELPVVYAHWGDEYVPATEFEKRAAHAFVDAGAEIVIGSHPHVVQEHETYQGKYIYYSLGNFIFDQYWNDAVRHGLLLDIVFAPTGVQSVREIPVELERDRRICPAA